MMGTASMRAARWRPTLGSEKRMASPAGDQPESDCGRSLVVMRVIGPAWLGVVEVVGAMGMR